ncbi:MAG TPA: hypothetical protein VGK19_24950 [Capsulimonadaceae bacterium]|jgi:hypothetical protein
MPASEIEWKTAVICGENTEYRQLDVNKDEAIIAEWTRTNIWFGLTTNLIIGRKCGTFACSDFGVVLDPEEIARITHLAGLTSGEISEALGFALAHEQAHMFQNQSKLPRDKMTREAHADLVAGCYIGTFLIEGNTWPEHIQSAAFAIGDRSETHHPPPETRTACVVKGMGELALQIDIDRRKWLSDEYHQRYEEVHAAIKTKWWNDAERLLHSKGQDMLGRGSEIRPAR